MSQSQLAKLMGVTKAEVADRIAKIRDTCRQLKLPFPIIVKRTERGVVYKINRKAASVLRHIMTTN